MTDNRKLVRLAAVLTVLVLVIAACSGDDGDSDSGSADDVSSTSVTSATTNEPPGGSPPVNPELADSVVPIGHFDSAQTDSTAVAGPVGPTQDLTGDDLVYAHIGPAHFGIAISPEYPDGERVIWSNGGDRITKLDYDSLEVLAELPLPDKDQLSAEDADVLLAELDSLEGRALADQAVVLATEYLFGLSGVYYLLDEDNTLFVGGSDSIIAYQDIDPDDPTSDIELRDEWPVPEEIGGTFVGANMTFDGRIVMVTNEGWVVVVERDFSDYEAIQMVGADGAVAHNQAMEAGGARPGSADWVRNSIAVDEDGGLYVVSVEHMHKVVWDGEQLSTDAADGAWTEPYLNGSAAGSGATPALMGFGDADDQFVVITDGEDLMNVVLYWRDDVPEGWTAPEGAPSDRIAGQQPADMGDPDLTAIQTEQSVVVGGYGAMVVNNQPASVPDDFPPAGVRVLAGYAGADPAYTPSGVQKFAWDPDSQEFAEAWSTQEVSSVNSVPVVSTGSDIVYTVGARDGDWTLEGINWETGESAFHWVTGSNRYNSLFSEINLDEDGRVMHTTAFGLLRYEPTD